MKDAAKYLDSLNILGSVPGLDSIRELLYRLGNPQEKVQFVHIAGTNGKGSTSAFIRAILMDAGYKVGRFNSPAVFYPLEIIGINNKDISEEDFAHHITEIAGVCDAMVSEGLNHPTRFEIETAAAFCYFSEQECDIAVVECGMGGLLDSTNIINTTVCSVITPLALDHTGFLGDSIEKIAAHKAGIIKNNVPVITADAYNEIVSTANAYNSELIVAGKPDNISVSQDGITFSYKEFCGLQSGLLGVYQPYNGALAIECAKVLRAKGYEITDENIRNGIQNAQWKGRFTKIGTMPDFYIDGAHNYHGAKALADCIENFYPDKKITFIMGVFADKEYDRILEVLIPYAERIYTIETPNNSRALSSKALAEFVKNNYDVFVYSCNEISEAVKLAYENADRTGVIVACGSLSHLATVEKENERYNHG